MVVLELNEWLELVLDRETTEVEKRAVSALLYHFPRKRTLRGLKWLVFPEARALAYQGKVFFYYTRVFNWKIDAPTEKNFWGAIGMPYLIEFHSLAKPIKTSDIMEVFNMETLDYDEWYKERKVKINEKGQIIKL